MGSAAAPEQKPTRKLCAGCGLPFNFPPSDNKADATLCAYCDSIVPAAAPVAAPQEGRDAMGHRTRKAFMAGNILECIDCGAFKGPLTDSLQYLCSAAPAVAPRPADEPPELLPCPFCGGEAVELEDRRVFCGVGVCSAFYQKFATREQWNRRANAKEKANLTITNVRFQHRAITTRDFAGYDIPYARVRVAADRPAGEQDMKTEIEFFKEGVRAAHAELDAAGVRREDVVWEGPVQHVTEYPVCDRIKFLAASRDRERELSVATRMECERETKTAIDTLNAERRVRAAASSSDRARAALQKIVDDSPGDCGCDHSNENCCPRVGYYCPFCIAALALESFSTTTPPAQEIYDQKEATKCIKCGHWLEFYNRETWKCEFQLSVAAQDARYGVGETKSCDCVCERPDQQEVDSGEGK